MLALLLVACLKSGGPTVYPVEQPELVTPERVELDPARDECAQVVPYLPGRPAPLLDEQGLVACRAQVVPESRLVQLLAAESLAPYWEAEARRCHEGRSRDRVWCQGVVDAVDLRARQAERSLAVRSLVTGGLFVVGLGVGYVVGVGIATAAP